MQVSGVSWQSTIIHHVSDAGLVRVEPGQQAGSSGAAASRVVELSESQTCGGKCIQRWCADFTAVTAEIREAHVVAEDHNDVGTRSWWSGLQWQTARMQREQHRQNAGKSSGQQLQSADDHGQHDVFP